MKKIILLTVFAITCSFKSQNIDANPNLAGSSINQWFSITDYDSGSIGLKSKKNGYSEYIRLLHVDKELDSDVRSEFSNASAVWYYCDENKGIKTIKSIKVRLVFNEPGWKAKDFETVNRHLSYKFGEPKIYDLGEGNVEYEWRGKKYTAISKYIFNGSLERPMMEITLSSNDFLAKY